MLPREYAKDLFLHSLARADVAATLHRQLSCTDDLLHIGTAQYPLPDLRRIKLVAVGKAAITMSHTSLQVIAPHLRSHQQIDGIVVAPTEPQHPDPHLHYHCAGHPTPDQSSRTAAQRVLHLLHRCDQHTLVLFLISGGASALLELPLDPAISVADTAAFHQALVHSGLPITAINTLRKHASAVKGGRLAEAASPARFATLLVSDVPGDDLSVIGSGPSLPDTSTLAACRYLLDTSPHLTLPPPFVRLLRSPDLPETPKPDDPIFGDATTLTLLSNADLLQHAASLATAAGLHAVIDNTPDDWDYLRAADYLLHRAHTLASRHPRLCLLSGGELSVPLAPVHGQGGRNQQFALHCALDLHRTQSPLTVLSAGSDGLDGNSPAAGAVVDQHTAADALQLGLSPGKALATFNAYPLLHQLGATLTTGPTGNNLRDLRILLPTR